MSDYECLMSEADYFAPNTFNTTLFGMVTAEINTMSIYLTDVL